MVKITTPTTSIPSELVSDPCSMPGGKIAAWRKEYNEERAAQQLGDYRTEGNLLQRWVAALCWASSWGQCGSRNPVARFLHSRSKLLEVFG